jgi:uncharacterized protein YprB with RNaseH-like and TPR domain
MQIDTQDYLRLVENDRSIVFVDIEAANLRADYGSTLVVSIKPWHKRAYSNTVRRVGNDKALMKWAKEELEQYDCWVTYYGKGFDIPFLNTRLLKWDFNMLEKRHHIDMYYSLKSRLLTSRRSLGHLVSWLELPEHKMGVSADEWSRAAADWGTVRGTMVRRCESDVRILEKLYDRTKHIIGNVTR